MEGMGPPEIKYGESLCFVQHAASGLWLTYAAADTKALRLGLLKRRVCVWGGGLEERWGGIWGDIGGLWGDLGGYRGAVGGFGRLWRGYGGIWGLWGGCRWI